jgi:peptidoglycan/xylan/chitin deacetylase (PgdA/CDA1 family)
MYHRVCADEEWHPSEFLVSKSIFRLQMEYLARHQYYTPRFSDVLGGALREDKGGRRPVILTFDDGYLDVYRNTLPVLHESGFTALAFLVTDFSRRANWWDRRRELQAPLMLPEHIKAIEAAGMELGSHTVSHRSLVGLTDRDLRNELVDSKMALEEIVHQPVSFLSYPYGDVDKRVKHAAHNAGYSCAFAGHSGPLRFDADLYEVRRVNVENNSSEAYLFWILSGLAKTYRWGKWVAKRMLGLHSGYHSNSKSRNSGLIFHHRRSTE